MADKYNKYCIDCKLNLSTTAIVFYGTFVCDTCADKIVETFGFMATYPKRIFSEHWDDYQLMCLASGCGGNGPLYAFLAEYEMETKTIPEKYGSRHFAWYQKRHQAMVQRLPFSDKPPSKTIKEAFDKRANMVKETADGFDRKTLDIAKKLQSNKTINSIWSKLTGTAMAPAVTVGGGNRAASGQLTQNDYNDETPDMEPAASDDMSHDDF